MSAPGAVAHPHIVRSPIRLVLGAPAWAPVHHGQGDPDALYKL